MRRHRPTAHNRSFGMPCAHRRGRNYFLRASSQEDLSFPSSPLRTRCYGPPRRDTLICHSFSLPAFCCPCPPCPMPGGPQKRLCKANKGPMPDSCPMQDPLNAGQSRWTSAKAGQSRVGVLDAVRDAAGENHPKAEAQGASKWMVDAVIKAPKWHCPIGSDGDWSRKRMVGRQLPSFRHEY